MPPRHSRAPLDEVSVPQQVELHQKLLYSLQNQKRILETAFVVESKVGGRHLHASLPVGQAQPSAIGSEHSDTDLENDAAEHTECGITLWNFVFNVGMSVTGQINVPCGIVICHYRHPIIILHLTTWMSRAVISVIPARGSSMIATPPPPCAGGVLTVTQMRTQEHLLQY